MSMFFSNLSETQQHNIWKEGDILVLERIEKWCKENGVSVSALEKKCALGNATITRWNKSMPRVDTLQKVSEVTGIPITELLEQKK